MKEFRIAGWMWNAEKPSETAVSVDIVEEVVHGIQKSTRYEFSVGKRYDTMSDEFKAAVRAALVSAGLI